MIGTMTGIYQLPRLGSGELCPAANQILPAWVLPEKFAQIINHIAHTPAASCYARLPHYP
jgi:hypothetical protein